MESLMISWALKSIFWFIWSNFNTDKIPTDQSSRAGRDNSSNFEFLRGLPFKISGYKKNREANRLNVEWHSESTSGYPITSLRVLVFRGVYCINTIISKALFLFFVVI